MDPYPDKSNLKRRLLVIGGDSNTANMPLLIHPVNIRRCHWSSVSHTTSELPIMLDAVLARPLPCLPMTNATRWPTHGAERPHWQPPRHRLTTQFPSARIQTPTPP